MLNLVNKLFLPSGRLGGFMKKFSFWFFIGTGAGLAFGNAFNNLGAGICLGIGLSAIITLLLNEYNNERA